MKVIEALNISKSYGRNKILSNTSFFAEEGQITGIEGENGSGKTTLLKIIIGLLSPDEGTIQKRGSIGYCPQDLMLFNSLTVRENFKYFAMAYGMMNKDEWMKKAEALTERFSMEKYMDTLVSKLSGGTKQKLNLSIALMHEPDLIILDEPYTAFDWECYLIFWEFVAELKKEGKSLLIVSHIIYDRSAIDKIYKLKNRQLECV